MPNIDLIVEIAPPVKKILGAQATYLDCLAPQHSKLMPDNLPQGMPST